MPAKTIEEVIKRLDAIIEHSIEQASALGIFACVYRQVTHLVQQGIASGRFENGSRMERLDVIFANRYLEGYDQYLAGLRPAKSWLSAFEAASHQDLLILQHLFVGMNAHINLDLGIAAAQAVAQHELPELENDFNQINKMLAEQIDNVQDALSKVSPLLILLDWFGKRSDEHFAEFSLVKARTHAWREAKRLSLLDEKTKQMEIEQLDGYVAVLNKLITQPGFLARGLIRLVKFFENKNIPTIISVLKNSQPASS